MADTPEVIKAADEEGRRPDIRPESARPMDPIGTSGTAIYAGNIVPVEKDGTLIGGEKWRKFGEILANVAIVGAGVRFFLNMVAAAKWKFEAPEGSGAKGQELAERVDKMVNAMETSWHRIVRKSAMYRFFGFSVGEWTMKRAEDGVMELADVQSRPQATITRWDTDRTGKVLGVLQTSPQTNVEVNIPRQKVLYLVDDSLSDSPEGLGLLRHIVESCRRLQKYEQLEAFGFEGNLKGVPLLKAPLQELLKEVKAGRLTKEGMAALLQPFKDLMHDHARNPHLAMLIDSAVYTTIDAAKTPSTAPQWGMELLDGGEYNLDDAAKAVERITMEIARVLGVEHLLLGSQSGSGGWALSKDKSNNFGLTVGSTLKEIREAVKKDLLTPLWTVNGWDPELMPEPVTDQNVTRDVEQLSAAIRDLAGAGVVLDREDDAVAEFFNLLGLPRLKGQILADPDAQLAGDGKGEDEEVPEGEDPSEDEGDEETPERK